MSTDTTTTVRTLHAVPEPHPPTGLTGALAAVYTELTTSPGSTSAELALAAGIGRSTAGKALTTLEQRGLAIRTPGEQHNGRRLPDRWHPAQPHAATQPQAETSVEIQSPEHVAGTVETDTAADPTASNKPHADNPENTAVPHETAQANPSEDNAETPQEMQPHKAMPAPATVPAAAVLAALSGHKARLAPGGLRQMVIDHLTAHPGEAFTATRISRAIDKSSGAIANALVTLVGRGIAEQVSDKPRTYRLARTKVEPADAE